MKIPTFEEYVTMTPNERLLVRQYQQLIGQEVYHPRRGIPSVLRGKPNEKNRGPRGPYPHIWLSGPDPVRHKQYDAWHKQRSQAHYRGEEYELSFLDFVDIWKDSWHLRGRKNHSLVMTRIDIEKPWQLTNVQLMERLQHLRRNGEQRKLKK